MKTILCFGDSNTYGYIPKVGGRFDEKTRWTGVLTGLVKDKGYTVIEEGQNGRTTVFDDPRSADRNGSYILPEILKREGHLDYAVIMLGTNDCKVCFHTDAEMIAEGMSVLLSMLRMYDTNMKIILLCPAPMTDNAVEDDDFDKESLRISAQLSERYSELARRYDCDFLDVGKLVTPSDDDGVHLDAGSHKLLGERLALYFA